MRSAGPRWSGVLAAIAGVLVVVLATSAWAASCANCENDGTGSCVCDVFEGRDPNSGGSSPYFWLKERKTGSTLPVSANPTAVDGAGICWIIDLDPDTGELDFVFRCTDRDYHLSTMIDMVLDSNEEQPGNPPRNELQFDEDFQVTSPTARRYLVEILTPWLTEDDLPSRVCMPDAAQPDCTITNKWDVDRDNGGEIKVNGHPAALSTPLTIDCRDIPLTDDVTTTYCPLTGIARALTSSGSPTTRATQPNRVLTVNVTTWLGGDLLTRSPMPTDCELNMGFVVGTPGVDNGPELCTVDPQESESDDLCAPADTGWEEADQRAIWFRSDGIGCTGSIRAVVEYSVL